MRTAIIAIATLTVGLPAVATAADVYSIDAEHSAIVFKVKHFNVAYTYGMFRKFEGSVTVDAKKAKNSKIELSIDSESVFTNVKKRDKHLRSPDFFNTKQFPKITFKSTKVRRSGKNWRVTGDLTMHGVTKSVAIKMKQTGQGDDPYGNVRIGFEGSFKVKRTDYGITKMVGAAGDAVHLMLSIEGSRKK